MTTAVIAILEKQRTRLVTQATDDQTLARNDALENTHVSSTHAYNKNKLTAAACAGMRLPNIEGGSKNGSKNGSI